MKEIDDYDLMDADFDLFLKIGQEEVEWESRQKEVNGHDEK